MSAFIVEPKTINVVLTAFHFWNDGRWVLMPLNGTGHSVETEEACAKLGQAMFDLNVESVFERYEGSQGYKREEFKLAAAPYSFKFEWVGPGVPLMKCSSPHLADAHAILKALDCWHYQACEGDCMEDPLFQTMDAVGLRLAHNLVAGSDAYARAETWR